MDFPITGLMDQGACSREPTDLLHPGGSACPGCRARDTFNVRRRRDGSPVVDYRRKGCRRVFNLFAGTARKGTHLNPVVILPILRGIAQGVPAAKPAREVGVGRQHPPRLRHKVRARAAAASGRSPRPDDRAGADEVYQNAGGKGVRHIGPADPPRRRANEAKGHGAWDEDRPPVRGAVGRRAGRLWARAGRRGRAAGPVRQTALPATRPGATAYTDGWGVYKSLPGRGRGHASVSHDRGGYARGDGGGGVRGVHCNTPEGIRTGPRNPPRAFRGVNKVYLSQYISIFQWSYDLKAATDGYLRVLLGCSVATELVT